MTSKPSVTSQPADNKQPTQAASRGNPNKKNDIWSDNIHLRTKHEDPTVADRLQSHNQILDESDKFIEFITHIENQKQLNLKANIQEIQLLSAQGIAQKNSNRYSELKFIVDEQETETESRDLNAFCKSVISVSFKHSEFGCIGTESCYKQKSIPKLFVDTLNTLQNALKPQSTDLAVSTLGALKAGEESIGNHQSQKSCKEFIGLMDEISAKKREIRRDLHIRDDYVNTDKSLKSSAFIGQKSQGGGIYSVPTKSMSALQTFVQRQHDTGSNSVIDRYSSAKKLERVHSISNYISPVKPSEQLPSVFRSPIKTFQMESAKKISKQMASGIDNKPSQKYIRVNLIAKRQSQDEEDNVMRVSKLLESHNSQKRLSILKNMKAKDDQYRQFCVPTILENKVPRHWLTFTEEILNELATVQNNVYDGQVIKGQRNGQGQMIYPNGDIYKGQYKNGERYGSGICKFGLTGAIYRGEWRDDKPCGNGILFTLPNEIIEARFDGFKVTDGQCKILMTNGEFYEGNFKFNQRNGTGIHHYRNGDYYDGEWTNDRRIGRGRLHQADGSKLSGMFIEDKADGYVEFEDKLGNMFQSENEEAKASKADGVPRVKKNISIIAKTGDNPNSFQPGSFINGKLYHLGVINFKNGDKYRGSFKDGRPCGYGTMKYNYSLPGSNGSEFEEATYEGLWKAGKREGQGTITWVDGSFFAGLWKCDMRLNGEMRFQNGNIYQGSFMNDKMHGKGRLLLASGIIFDGKFNYGCCDSIGKLRYPSGDIYVGQHRSFVKNGQGKIIYLNGSTYEGCWENDKKSQRGRMFDHVSGDVYNGDYLEGKRNGRGRMYYAVTQEIYDGDWQNDRRQGEGYILNRKGEVSSGDFRADHMEGKLTYQKTLGLAETEKTFKAMIETNDIFIIVNKKKVQIDNGLVTKAQISSSTFKKIKKSIESTA